jgi:hypothetical protein
MKRLYLILLLLGCVKNESFAQFQTGIYSSNYSGVMGLVINPANSNYLSNGTDFTPFTFSTSVLNNGYYLDSKPITKILSPSVLGQLTGSSGNGDESINQTFDRVFSLKRSFKPKNYIFAGATIYGPSASINYYRHSFGILTSFKSASSNINLPKEMEIFLLKGPSAIELIDKTVKLNNFASATLVYTDIAFNYSYKIVDSRYSTQGLGITAHYLNGINSLNFEETGGNTKWTFHSDSSITMENGNIRFNYAATKSIELGDISKTRGRGFAFDIGYTFLRKNKARPTRLTVCPNIRYGGKTREYQDYKWKFGVSLMDLGRISFTKETVQSQYENAYGPSKNIDQSFYNGVFALERRLRFDYAYNTGTKYTVENKYTHFTASRLNVQFDYHYKENLYLSFFGSHRLPMPNVVTMSAPNILSLSVRYEKLKYEIGLPISLVEYQYPILGFNFRTGPFYFGTNHLLELVGLRNIRGLDLYFGVKFNFSNFRGV